MGPGFRNTFRSELQPGTLPTSKEGRRRTLSRASSTTPLAIRVVRKGPSLEGEMISLIAVAQLIVRNLDEDLVQRLKRRAASHGRSAEEEHRQLLRQVLRPEGLGEALLAMPNVGDDPDFARQSDMPRELDLR